VVLHPWLLHLHFENPLYHLLTTPHTSPSFPAPPKRHHHTRCNHNKSPGTKFPLNSFIAPAYQNNQSQSLESIKHTQSLSSPFGRLQQGRSVLYYASPIYGLAPPSYFRLLDPIQNSVLRIAMGALRTNPALNLSAEAGILLLHFRHFTLTGKFLATASSYPSFPIHQYLFETCFNNPRTPHLRYTLCRELEHNLKFHCLHQ